MNPIDDPDAYDEMRISGVLTPALVRVTDVKAPRKWDRPKSPGQSGGAIKYAGDEFGSFTTYFYAWEAEHFIAWELVAELTKKSPTPVARDVSHPSLSDPDVAIRSAVVEEAGPWLPEGDKGMFVKKIVWGEWRPPTPASAKPAGSKGGSNGGAGASASGGQPTAKDEYDQMIEDMTKQVKDLSQ